MARGRRRRRARDRDLARGPARLAQRAGPVRASTTALDVVRAGRRGRCSARPRRHAGLGARCARARGWVSAGAGGDAAAYPWRFWLDGEPTRLRVPSRETASQARRA